MQQFLGTEHMSHTEAVTHNTTYNNAIDVFIGTLILDGTYIYLPKIADHKLQISYSGQKKRNSVKFMSIVFPHCYILDTVDQLFDNEIDV